MELRIQVTPPELMGSFPITWVISGFMGVPSHESGWRASVFGSSLALHPEMFWMREHAGFLRKAIRCDQRGKGSSSNLHSSQLGLIRSVGGWDAPES